MARTSKQLHSRMAHSTVDRITVCGLDLSQDILGKLSLGDFAFLEIQGRVPSKAESTVFNAMLATLVEHGMTPMAIATRMTYLGAPESLQAAVAAGLCGMGTTFAGTAEGAAKLLQEALAAEGKEPNLREVAALIVDQCIANNQAIPGIGHPLHKPVDPRTIRLFEIAQENGLCGRYVFLMKMISEHAELAYKKPGALPVNATGALAALASELQIPWQLCRGLAVIGRAIGLVGHIAEEIRNPLAKEIWQRADEEVSQNYSGA